MEIQQIKSTIQLFSCCRSPAFFMGPVFSKWVFAFSLSCCLVFTVLLAVEGLHGNAKVKGVNLVGWLVIEGWIKPSLFYDIPNGEMLDGTQVQLKSVTLQKYVCAENGGGTDVSVNRDVASSWETFTVRGLVSESKFQFRTSQGQFLTCDGEGCSVSATAKSPSTPEIFKIERNNNSRVHIKLTSGTYLQATLGNQLTADYPGIPGRDDNTAMFEMTIVANDLHGDYQRANGYGHDRAKDVLKQRHRNTFYHRGRFQLSVQTWNQYSEDSCWLVDAFDPDPPAPFIGGSLEALDNAFSWAQAYDLKCIIDLHAAPGSQNGMEHSASRDGSTDCPASDNISQTLHVIDFLASRYARHPAMLGIKLLNEPSAATVTLDILISYYKQGYQIVRKYSPTAYVIMCQRIGNADPLELYQANVGSHNIVVDLHYYNLFDTFFVNLSSVDNILFIYKSREAQLQALNSANGPLVFIGEWVNEWNMTSGSREDYQDFGRAQLEVYNAASFGWAYWTLKNDRKHWDFEWNIRNNYLQLGKSPKMQNLNNLVFLGLVCAWLYLHHMLRQITPKLWMIQN